MADDVAARELGQRRVAVERTGRRDALVEQGVGELLAAARAAADQRVDLGAHQQVAERLAAGGGDAGPAEGGVELGAGQGLAALERPGDRVVAAREERLVEAELALLV